MRAAFSLSLRTTAVARLFLVALGMHSYIVPHRYVSMHNCISPQKIMVKLYRTAGGGDGAGQPRVQRPPPLQLQVPRRDIA